MTVHPTILISHGSWHEPLHWTKQKAALEKAGYEVVIPRLPSLDGLPHVALREDAAMFRREIQRLVNAGKEVVCVGHSYGGMVISEAPTQEQTREYRAAKGQEGGITHLIYVAAFLAGVGESLGGCLGGELPPNLPCDQKGYVSCANPHDFFYHDVPASDVEEYVRLLKPVPSLTQFWPLSSSALTFIPSTYLICTEDKGLPPFVQQMMVDKALGQSAKMTVEKCAHGHSPYMVEPGLLVEMVGKLEESK